MRFILSQTSSYNFCLGLLLSKASLSIGFETYAYRRDMRLGYRQLPLKNGCTCTALGVSEETAL